jgi:pimeloyl-ACP methyl ester carboxylesterase
MGIPEFPMKRKVFFPNSRNNKLCGILSDPSARGLVPIAVLCHGFSTSKEGRTYVKLEEILNRRHAATFRFDFFGHGESEGKLEDITVSEAVDDVLSAILYVRESGYSRIGLMGSSFGGLASLVAAGRSGDLHVLALKSPVSDYIGLRAALDDGRKDADWKKNGYIDFKGAEGQSLRLNFSFYEDAEKYGGGSYAPRIKVPVLIVHGDQDKTVPLEQSEKAASLIPGCRLEVIEGADHTYSNPKLFERMLDLIASFLLRESGLI